MLKKQLDLFCSGNESEAIPRNRLLQKHIPPHFSPDYIILAKGSIDSLERKVFVDRICSFFPQATIEERLDTPHNRIVIGDESNAFSRHVKGKKTLVLGVMNSAVRLSNESGNTCPNYWHYSVFGFCPFGCAYCYLAGTPGVWYSPSVKIYVNLPEIISAIDKQARVIACPVSFYHGKLQDGLALEPIAGYMKMLIPFFARHPFARHIILTKSDAVNSLLSLDHGGHTILSWSLNPPEIAQFYEPNTPSIGARIHAMKLCADKGYPIRAVLIPVIPASDWKRLYSDFLDRVLSEISLTRLTIGGICSYSHANKLMTQRIGHENAISEHMSDRSS
ncbi:MAG: spore photoproduct lyase family protein, partial [Candidatus Latescibacterota bacterium]